MMPQVTDLVAAISSMPMPAGVLELDGTIVAINQPAEALVGRRAADLVGRRLTPGAEPVWAERIANLRAGHAGSHDIELATAAGPCTVEYQLSLATHQGREVVLAWGMDISRHVRGLDVESTRRLE